MTGAEYLAHVRKETGYPCRMSRKRYIKLLMSRGYQRDVAEYAALVCRILDGLRSPEGVSERGRVVANTGYALWWAREIGQLHDRIII